MVEHTEKTIREEPALATLDTLEPGKDAVIAAVKCADVALRKHILDMGLTPGTEVMLVKRAPMGDPIELRLRGYELTLRNDDASHIELTDVHEAGKYSSSKSAGRSNSASRKG